MKDDKFWRFVRERESIRCQRVAGLEPPYTTDERLRDYHFPNIRRIDDPSRMWFIRDVLDDLAPERACMAALLHRLFAHPDTTDALRPMFAQGYSEALMLDLVGPIPRSKRFGLDALAFRRSLAGVAQTADAAKNLWVLLRGADLRDATTVIASLPGVGPEVAYEVVYDLRHCSALRRAYDAQTWALPSTAATLGAGVLLDREMSSTRLADRISTVSLMRSLLKDAQAEWPRWEMSEMQRALSLFYRWVRGPRPKRRFRWK